MDMLVNGLRVMRVCMEEIELGRKCGRNIVRCGKHMVQKRGEEESDVQRRGKWDGD